MAIIVNKNQNAAAEINGIAFAPKNGFMVSTASVTGAALALFKSIPGFEVLDGTDTEDGVLLGAASNTDELDAALAREKAAERRALVAEQRAQDAAERADAATVRANTAEAAAVAAAQAQAAAEAALAAAEAALTAAQTKAAAKK